MTNVYYNVEKKKKNLNFQGAVLDHLLDSINYARSEYLKSYLSALNELSLWWVGIMNKILVYNFGYYIQKL